MTCFSLWTDISPSMQSLLSGFLSSSEWPGLQTSCHFLPPLLPSPRLWPLPLILWFDCVLWFDSNSNGGSEFESTSSSQEKTPWHFCPWKLSAASPLDPQCHSRDLVWLPVVLHSFPQAGSVCSGSRYKFCCPERSSYSTHVHQITDQRVRCSPLSSQIPWWHAQTKKTFKNFLLLPILLLFWILLVLCIVSRCHVQLCDPVDWSPPDSSVRGDSPDESTEVGTCFLFQRIFPIQGSNPCLPHCRQTLDRLSHQGRFSRIERLQCAKQ